MDYLHCCYIYGGDIMSLLQAILMGLLQGVTEFLPVSSSGHLAIFKYLFHVNTETGLLFDTLLHLGTLIAVCVVYWGNVRKLVVAAVRLLAALVNNIGIWIGNLRASEKSPYRPMIDDAYKKFVVLILITTIPTGIIGLLLKPLISRASQSLLIPGICLVITAIILLVSDSGRIGKKKIKRARYSDAALIGVAQGIATMPGISRSGSTIAACLMLGFDRAFAVQYSFLASIPAIIGANLLELKDLDVSVITGNMLVYYLVGMVVAGIVGYICIKAMIVIVKSKKFSYFAYYCAIIGVICIAVYFIRG